MKKILYTLCLSFFLLANTRTHATHVRGGQMEYKPLGKDTFLVRLTMYRDCSGIPNDNSVTANVENIDAGGCQAFAITLTKIGCQDITNLCATACRPCSQTSCNSTKSLCQQPITSFGIEKIVYEGKAIFPSNLNSKCCSFRISYSLCCRNNNITTGSGGQTLYLYAELNRCIKPTVGAFFNNDPLMIINRSKCQNLDFSINNQGAHDSISYHLGKSLNTAINDPITYNSPLSYVYPLNSYVPSAAQGGNSNKPWLRVAGAACSGFFLDSIAGTLTFKPSNIEQGPVCVDAKIWRYDSTAKKIKQIGMIRRDLTLVIMDTTNNNPPTSDGPDKVTVCEGDTVKIENFYATDIDSVKVGNNWIPRDTVDVSEYIANLPGATFTKTRVGAKVKWSLVWPTIDSLASEKPYIFGLRVLDRYCPVPGFVFKNVLVYVKRKANATMNVSIDTACFAVHLKAIPDSTKLNYKSYSYQWQVGNNVYNAQDTMVSAPSGKNYIQLSVGNGACDLVLKDSVDLPNHFYISSNISNATYCKYTKKTFYMTPHFNKGPVKYWVNNVSLGSVDSFQVTVLADEVFNIIAQDSAGCFSYAQALVKSMQPVISTGKNVYTCNSDSTTIDAGDNAGAGNLSYYWRNSANPSVVISNNRTITRNDAATLYIKVTDNSTSCSEYDTVTINKVIAAPVTSNDTHFCAGSTVQLSATGAAAFFWSYLSNGSAYTTGANISYAADSTTSFVLKGVSITNGLTCIGYDTIHLYKDLIPKVNLGKDTTLCGNAINITLDAGAGGASYLWEDSSTSQTRIVTAAGQKWVKVTSNYGCVGFDLINITGVPFPVVNLGNDTSFCDGQAVSLTLNAKSAGNNSYKWQDGTKNSIYPLNTPGLYWVKVTNASGCSSYDSILVNQGTSPKFNLGNDTAICANQAFNITLDPKVGVLHKYIWQDGATSATYTAQKFGRYTVTVSNVSGCKGNDTIDILSIAAPIIHLGNDTTLKQGDSLLLDAGAGMKTYMWNTGATSQNIYAKDSGKYIVKVTNQAGCDGADTIVIVTLTGISQPVDETIYTIYPNPTSKYINVDCNNKNLLPKYCELYTMDGKFVKRLSATGGDVSELSNGFYLLYIHSPQGLMIRKLEVRQ
jgi:hypothetical protein